MVLSVAITMVRRVAVKMTKLGATKPKKQKKVLQGPVEYRAFFDTLKQHISMAQLATINTVNIQLLKLYWELGKQLTEGLETQNLGSGVIEKLQNDLQRAFPGMEGFSRASLSYMRMFYVAYKSMATENQASFDQLVFFRIPWGHNILILTKIKNSKERVWYAQKTIINGWSRNVLAMWIESDLYNRQGQAVTNFKLTLPDPQSDLAHEALKDPYNFDFLTMTERATERDIESGLMAHVESFLTELGSGFAFVARQYALEVAGEISYIDLLFYHLKLRCYVVVELKVGDFDPRDAGQINFYLAAIDDLLRDTGDNPSIGLLLCRTKNKVKAEYAVRNSKKPIGVASYTTKLIASLPKKLKTSLPSIDEIEEGLSVAQPKAKVTKRR